MMEELMLAIGHWCLDLVGWETRVQSLDRYPATKATLEEANKVLEQMLSAHHPKADILSGPYYVVGSSTPYWYRETGATFRGTNLIELVPQYDDVMLHTGYEIEIKQET